MSNDGRVPVESQEDLRDSAKVSDLDEGSTQAVGGSGPDQEVWLFRSLSCPEWLNLQPCCIDLERKIRSR